MTGITKNQASRIPNAATMTKHGRDMEKTKHSLTTWGLVSPKVNAPPMDGIKAGDHVN